MRQECVGKFVHAGVHEAEAFALACLCRHMVRPGGAVEDGHPDLPILDAVTAFAVVEQGDSELSSAVLVAHIHPSLAGLFLAVHGALDVSVWNRVCQGSCI